MLLVCWPFRPSVQYLQLPSPHAEPNVLGMAPRPKMRRRSAPRPAPMRIAGRKRQTVGLSIHRLFIENRPGA
jgi:hypothetical protein